MSSADMPNVHIDLKGRGGVIEVDGHNVTNATLGLALKADGSGRRELTLNLLVHETAVDGEMKVNVPQETAEALVALGWTPPAEEATP